MPYVRRNAIRKIAAIREAIVWGEIYSIDYDFESKPITNMEYVWDEYAKYNSHRLVDCEDGTYVIEVHSNLWYKLHTQPLPASSVEETSQSAAVAEPTQADGQAPEQPVVVTVWTVEMEPTMGVMGVWATPELAKAAAEKHAQQALTWYAAPKGEFRALHDERNPQHCPVWSVVPHVVRDSVEQEG